VGSGCSAAGNWTDELTKALHTSDFESGNLAAEQPLSIVWETANAQWGLSHMASVTTTPKWKLWNWD
jgi:hypothetical protein